MPEKAALKVAHRACVSEGGRVVPSGPGAALVDDARPLAAHLGR